MVGQRGDPPLGGEQVRAYCDLLSRGQTKPAGLLRPAGESWDGGLNHAAGCPSATGAESTYRCSARQLPIKASRAPRNASSPSTVKPGVSSTESTRGLIEASTST